MKLRALLVCMLLLAACGNDDSPNEQAEAATPAAASGSGGEVDGSSTDANDVRRGGELTYALVSFPEPIDPLSITTRSAKDVGRTIFDTLVTVDESAEIVPLLAESFETPDGGATWVLDLREGVLFHDGTTFDAASVVAHTERLMDPENNCRCIASVSSITSVEATDDFQVTYTLEAPSASFPATLAGPVGMIGAAGTSPDLPIGTGPFTFVESIQDDSIRVERNPDYWQDGLPYLDEVTFRAIPDSATRYAAIQSGEVDMYWENSYQRWQEIRGNDDLQLIEFGGFGSYYITFNMGRPPFDQIEARRAVAMALDLETLHETLHAGQIQPATSIFPRNTWAYPGEIDSYPTYDLEGARGLVEDLGGISFTLLTPELVYEQAVAVQAMLMEAGMDVDVQRSENIAAIEQVTAGDYDAAQFSFTGDIEPLVFASRYGTGNPRNTAQMSDPRMDELLEAADTTIGNDDRAGIFAEIAEVAAEIMPYALLANHNDAWVARADILGIPSTPDGVVKLTSASRSS
ncbi:ABC transporter substrate-binding protein [Acidimicrobiia bacterium EGI L10123]|uniref:ABC transporter substrate-binding protein n=1 Tax=Salinilacustrithrix flava TaxID=2957203 RepID=UPI003D7C21A5|nr:ABC transporter substrate-binding protein [Acidimicrobiia bacterium EGI L10123]